MKQRLFKTMILSLLLLLFGAILSVSALAADDYPYSSKSFGTYRIPEDVDPWNFYYRECTSFVAWCLNSRNSIAFHNQYGGVTWGNAGNWGDAARLVGINVDMNPTVGSVGYDSGHIVWVSAVDGDNVTIEEYNFGYTGLYNSRTVSKYIFSGFIHFDGSPVPTTNFDYYVDSITGGANSINLTGWVFNRDNITKAIQVHAYIDGGPGSGASGYVIEANVSRKDVDNVHHCGEFHGFSYTITGISAGTHEVQLFAVDQYLNQNQKLGDYSVSVKTGQASVDKGQDGVYAVGENVIMSTNAPDDAYILSIIHTPPEGETYLYWEGTISTQQYMMSFP